MENNNFVNSFVCCSIFVKRILKLSLISAAITLLSSCGSTTPILDAKIGTALIQAKIAQSIPTSESVNKVSEQQGAGLPTATESLLGLSVHNAGRSASSALTVK